MVKVPLISARWWCRILWQSCLLRLGIFWEMGMLGVVVTVELVGLWLKFVPCSLRWGLTELRLLRLMVALLSFLIPIVLPGSFICSASTLWFLRLIKLPWELILHRLDAPPSSGGPRFMR